MTTALTVPNQRRLDVSREGYLYFVNTRTQATYKAPYTDASSTVDLPAGNYHVYSTSTLSAGVYLGTISISGAGSVNLTTLLESSNRTPTNMVNVADYGAIGDGTLHQLSERYSTLAEAQADYPFATALTQSIDWAAIQKAVNTGATNVYFPKGPGGGAYIISDYVVVPYTSSRHGYLRFFGDGSSHPVYGTVIRRSNSNAGIRFAGVSFVSSGGSNSLAKYLRIEGMQFDGGWSNFNTSSDYPMLDFNAGYEFIWNDVIVTNCLGHGVLMREVMDSRFHDVRITTCGELYGKQLTLSLTNGSVTATTSSTTGLFVGQRIYGLGQKNVRIASITNSTTFTMTAASNYTGDRLVSFEAKAAMHIGSNDTGSATSNNLVMTGFRFESGPGCALRIHGSNIIDIWLENFKAEHTHYALDYLLDIDACSGVHVDEGWLYGFPDYRDNMEWPVTTAGTTLASLDSAALATFTLPTYSVQTGTLTAGSALITGLADTSTLFVGQSISGSGITAPGLDGVKISAINSATSITANNTASASAAGTKSLTFKYNANLGNFWFKQLHGGMPIVAYDTTDPRNYLLGRVVSYGDTTGEVTLHVLSVHGNTGASITSWKVAVTHIGMVRFGNGAQMCSGSFKGGWAASNPVTGLPYLHTLCHVDGVRGLDVTWKPNGGASRCMPKNTFQGQRSSSSNTIGTGAKTFTVATGLPADYFAAGSAVFISGWSAANNQNWMIGTVTSYTSGTGALVVDITRTNGSGTLNDWTIAYAPQSYYYKSGTNRDTTLKEYNTFYAVPANSAGAIREVISDPKAASGSQVITNMVHITEGLFATITKDSSTLYIITDGSKGVYLGSTLIAS